MAKFFSHSTLSKPACSMNARLTLAFFLAPFFPGVGLGQQTQLPLVDGMVLGPGQESKVEFTVLPTASVNSNLVTKALLISVLDDGLRKTYVNFNRCGAPVQVNDSLLKIELGNRSLVADKAQSVPPGPIINCSQFDVFGRRICFVRRPDGEVAKIVQGITEVTSNFVRVEGLRGEKGVFEWDMRVSLSSFDSEKLQEILMLNASQTKSKDWLEIVNLFSSAKRFVEARKVLVLAIQKFSELESIKSELKRLDQNIADQLFAASETAQQAGQFQFSKRILENIKKAGLSIETQLKVEGKLEALANGQKDRDELIGWMTDDIAKIPDATVRAEMQSLLPEITANLTADTALRFTDYRRRKSDATLKPEQLAALAVSGWIFGPAAGKDNALVVASGIKARRLITQYLSKTVRDDQILQELTKLESGTPDLVAKIIANMSPPKPTLDSEAVLHTIAAPESSQSPSQSPIQGRFAIEVPMGGDMLGRTARYMVQLPPEYNPFRRYPCIFTLPGELSNMEWQIAWWAGYYSPEAQRCFGEASKRGYIVVSPDWAEPKQPSYNYTENEHALILAPLRDAMRRFSIDTDRVFLSGHFMGADAAWDIGLAHPDLWAGNIVISGEARKYVIQYMNNAYYVPSYFVSGELDKFTETNGKEWDKLLSIKQIDCLVTLYRGRKPDHFQEELPRIMDWMSFPARVRNPFPKEFKATTSRAGDRFFWWFETKQLFQDKLVPPLLYKAGFEYEIKSTIIKENNTVLMETVPAKNFTLWLSPEIIDLEKEIHFSIKGKRERRDPKPDSRVILEDVRGRADRQHPFWMRVDFPK